MNFRRPKILFAPIVFLLLFQQVEAKDGPFRLLGVEIGQAVESVKKQNPDIVCEISCVLPEANFLGYPGNFWAGIEDGRISQLAFGFKPKLGTEAAKQVRNYYVNQYGAAADNLGLDGCDEWKVAGGYLAICLMPELSHIWWSKESRVDINIQNQRKADAEIGK